VDDERLDALEKAGAVLAQEGGYTAFRCCPRMGNPDEYGYDISDLHDTGNGESGEFTLERATALVLVLNGLPDLLAEIRRLRGADRP
jgi:hypothetical protein